MKVLVFYERSFKYGSGAELATITFIDVMKNILGIQVRQFVFSNISKYYSSKYLVNIHGVNFSRIIIKEISETDVVYAAHYWVTPILFARVMNVPSVLHLHDNILLCPNATRVLIDNSMRECFEKLQSISISFKCFPCIVRHNIIVNKSASKGVLGAILNPFFDLYRIALIKSVRCIICPTKYLAKLMKYLVNERLRLAIPIEVVYNPLPLSLTKISLPDASEKKYIVCLGVNLLKGIDVLLRALAYVNVPIEIIVPGCRTSKQAFRINKAKVLVIPKLDHERYIDLLKFTKIVIVPTKIPEPSPYAIIEPLACGCLVIASRIGGIPEIVHGAPGTYLVEPQDYKQLAELINYVSSLHHDEIYELGLKNRHIALKRFDPIEQTKRLVNAFKYVLQRNN